MSTEYYSASTHVFNNPNGTEVTIKPADGQTLNIEGITDFYRGTNGIYIDDAKNLVGVECENIPTIETTVSKTIVYNDNYNNNNKGYVFLPTFDLVDNLFTGTTTTDRGQGSSLILKKVGSNYLLFVGSPYSRTNNPVRGSLNYYLYNGTNFSLVSQFYDSSVNVSRMTGKYSCATEDGSVVAFSNDASGSDSTTFILFGTGTSYVENSSSSTYDLRGIKISGDKSLNYILGADITGRIRLYKSVAGAAYTIGYEFYGSTGTRNDNCFDIHNSCVAISAGGNLNLYGTTNHTSFTLLSTKDISGYGTVLKTEIFDNLVIILCTNYLLIYLRSGTTYTDTIIDSFEIQFVDTLNSFSVSNDNIFVSTLTTIYKLKRITGCKYALSTNVYSSSSITTLASLDSFLCAGKPRNDTSNTGSTDIFNVYTTNDINEVVSCSSISTTNGNINLTSDYGSIVVNSTQLTVPKLVSSVGAFFYNCYINSSSQNLVNTNWTTILFSTDTVLESSSLLKTTYGRAGTTAGTRFVNNTSSTMILSISYAVSITNPYRCDSTVFVQDFNVNLASQMIPSQTVASFVNGSAIFPLEAGKYFEICVWPETGTSTQTNSRGGATLQVYRLR